MTGPRLDAGDAHWMSHRLTDTTVEAGRRH
jgi:hypothetical protein